MFNDAAITYGTPLVDDDKHRIGDLTVLGLDELLFCRLGRWRTQTWSIQIVDVDTGVSSMFLRSARLLACGTTWFRGDAWCCQIQWAALGFSGPYHIVFDTILLPATQAAAAFHVVKLAYSKLDECRRRC